MSADWASARRRSALSALRWLRTVIPVRSGITAATTGIRVGSTMVTSTKKVQIAAASNDKVHPTSKARTAAGAESVRRRLSTIFQRPIAGMAPRFRSSLTTGPRPKIQGSNCQSPRAQRWCRRAAMS